MSISIFDRKWSTHSQIDRVVGEKIPYTLSICAQFCFPRSILCFPTQGIEVIQKSDLDQQRYGQRPNSVFNDLQNKQSLRDVFQRMMDQQKILKTEL
jgi:hypothetical protein